jgi:hypothetical protein
LSDDQPVEEHPDRGEMQLHRRLGVRRAELLDVCGDERWIRLLKSPNISLRAPTEEITHGASVRDPRRPAV